METDLSLNEFWEQPPALRHAAFAQLRALPSPQFFEVPETPFAADDARLDPVYERIDAPANSS